MAGNTSKPEIARFMEKLDGITITEAGYIEGDNLRFMASIPSDLVARIAESAADQLSSASEYLRRHGARDLVRDVEDFARRRPEVFLTAAALVGIAAARFVKASGRRVHASDGGRDYGRSDDGRAGGTGMGMRNAPGVGATTAGPTAPIGPMNRPGAWASVWAGMSKPAPALRRSRE